MYSSASFATHHHLVLSSQREIDVSSQDTINKKSAWCQMLKGQHSPELVAGQVGLKVQVRQLVMHLYLSIRTSCEKEQTFQSTAYCVWNRKLRKGKNMYTSPQGPFRRFTAIITGGRWNEHINALNSLISWCSHLPVCHIRSEELHTLWLSFVFPAFDFTQSLCFSVPHVLVSFLSDPRLLFPFYTLFHQMSTL